MAENLPTPAVPDLTSEQVSDRLPGVVLAAVPGCEQGQPPLAVQLLVGGGGHNDVRRVDTHAGRFVVRRRLPPLSRPGSDAALELECQRLAARQGLAPGVVAAAADASWMVMEFVAGNIWQENDLASESCVRRLGARLAQVHAIKIHSGLRPMDAAAIAREQLQLITSTVATVGGRKQEAADLADRAIQLAQILRTSATSRDMPSCINHGDLQVANLVGPLPVFVDWEYAQIAAPTYDIACLMTYYPRLRPLQAELMAAAGLARPEDLERLELQQQLFSCLNRLWGIANGLDAG